MLFAHILFLTYYVFSLSGYPEIFSITSDCVFKFFGTVVPEVERSMSFGKRNFVSSLASSSST